MAFYRNGCPGIDAFERRKYKNNFAKARAKIAIQKEVLKGILWHQGESDNDSINAKVYKDKLLTLVNMLHQDLQQPELSFVVGEIGCFNKNNFINKEMIQLPELLPNNAVVSAKELTDKGDHLHFDTSSARELGKRYAKAMKKLQEKKLQE